MKKIILILALIFSCGLTAQTKIYEIQNKGKGVMSELTPANLLLIKDDFAKIAISNIKGLGDALNLKEDAFSKNTAFNKNFGTTAGTVVEGGTLGSNAYSSTDYFKYETFYADANTLPVNRSAFTYATNAPHTGTLVYFGAVRYGTQINTSYKNGDSFSFRTLDGDVLAWNPWRRIWHDGNFNPANYLPLSGGTLSGAISGTSATFQGSVTASPATLPNHVVVKSQLDALASSGTYTPTTSNLVNLNYVNIIINSSSYIKIGNIVYVSIRFGIKVVANGNAFFNITLPFNRTLTHQVNQIGLANIDNGGGYGIVSFPPSTNNECRVFLTVNQISDRVGVANFQYSVLD